MISRMRSAFHWLRAGDRWIPGCFIAFFVCLALWEATLIHRAVTSFNGKVTDDPYIKGRTYNVVIAENRAQKALGWDVDALFDQTGPTSGLLQLTAADADGAPLAGARPLGVLKRYDGELHAFDLAFAEVAPGRFKAKIAAPSPGRWTAEMKLRRGEESYRLRQTFVLIPE